LFSLAHDEIFISIFISANDPVAISFIFYVHAPTITTRLETITRDFGYNRRLSRLLVAQLKASSVIRRDSN